MGEQVFPPLSFPWWDSRGRNRVTILERKLPLSASIRMATAVNLLRDRPQTKDHVRRDGDLEFQVGEPYPLAQDDPASFYEDGAPGHQACKRKTEAYRSGRELLMSETGPEACPPL